MERTTITRVTLLNPEELLVEFSNETAARIAADRLTRLVLETPECITGADAEDDAADLNE